MSKLRVLVVGASIAGPSVAYWFAKAGANVTVIERFPKLRTNGQNIDIRTVGVTIMRKIPGMEADVKAKVTPLDGLSFVDNEGRPYGMLRQTGNPDHQSLVSEYEIFRGDLSQILVNLTKDNQNVKYIFGEQVASIQQNEKDSGPLKVEFANGLPASEYDLVVACDGAASRTRAIGLGVGIRDYVKPANSWAAYYTVDKDFLGGSTVGRAHTAVGGRFVGVGPSPSTVNHVKMMALCPNEKTDISTPFRNAMKQGDDAMKAHVAQHFQNSGWITNDLLDSMMSSESFYASEILEVRVPSMYKGRFVLVGDAACSPAFTGGGTSLAMAGAYILAGEVSKRKGDLAAGLQAYEDRMRPIIADLQKVPPFVSTFMAPQTAWGIWIRNQIFALITWSGVLNFASKYISNVFASGDRYNLPDYEWTA